MAITFMDSCQKYVLLSVAHTSILAIYDTVNQVQAVSLTDARSATGLRFTSGSGSYVQKAVPGLATRHGALRARFDSLPTSGVITLTVLYEGATAHLSIHVTTMGAIEVRRGTHTGTILGTSADGLVAPLANPFVSWKATIHDSTGAVEVKVDGVSVINLTGVDTRNGGAAGVIDGVRLGGAAAVTGSVVWSGHDIVIGDTTGTGVGSDILDDAAVDAYPSADAALDELAPDDDTTHLALAAAGAATPVVGYLDLPSGVTNVIALQHVTRWRKDDAAVVEARQRLASGASLHEPVPVALGTAYTTRTEMHSVSPFTGVAWTASEVNGLTGNIERTT